MYYVYMITNNRNTVLYTGITNDIQGRTFDHKTHLNPGFTDRYNCDKLVYFEEFENIDAAIAREKQLKKYKRIWKENLINKTNPEWKDFSNGWYDLKEIEYAKKINSENQKKNY